jgi:predicted outer membrane repeat protein
MEHFKSVQLNRKRWFMRLGLTLGLGLLFLVALLHGLQGMPMIHADPGTLYVDDAQGQDTPTCGTTIAPCHTISYALNDRATDGDVIRVAQGVYTDNLVVDKRVTLEGGYESAGWTRSVIQHETIIDGSGSVVSQSVVIFQTGSDGAVLDGFTLRNGEAKFGGGAHVDNGAVTISDTTFLSNTAEYGGGLAVGGSAAATIVGCQFISNTAYQAGGLRGDGNVTIEDSVFQGNSAQENGGAIQAQGLVVRGSRILNNSASCGGGVDVFGSALLEDVEIVGNAATYQGGGFRVGDSRRTVTLSNTRILSNTAESGGGLFVQDAGEVTIVGCQFISNTATDGGGMQWYDGSIGIYDTLVKGNRATSGAGGGISAAGKDSVVISDTRVLDNTAPEGGGVDLRDGSICIYNTVVRGNEALLGEGGGIRAYYCELRHSPQLTLVNTLIASNRANVWAGGVRIDQWPATLINTTIADNYAGYLYAGVWASPLATQTVAFTNTILWDNGIDDLECSSGCTVAYSNLEQPLEEGVWPGTGNISEDPQFVDAANGDYRLQMSSRCINAGTSLGAPTRDIDDTPRDATPDMGAYEWPGSHIYLPLTLKKALNNPVHLPVVSVGGASLSYRVDDQIIQRIIDVRVGAEAYSLDASGDKGTIPYEVTSTLTITGIQTQIDVTDVLVENQQGIEARITDACGTGEDPCNISVSLWPTYQPEAPVDEGVPYSFTISLVDAEGKTQLGDVMGEIFNPFELEELGPIIDLDQVASLLQSDSRLKYEYKDTNRLEYSCGQGTHLGDGSLLYAAVPADDPIEAPTYDVYAPIKAMPVRIGGGFVPRMVLNTFVGHNAAREPIFFSFIHVTELEESVKQVFADSLGLDPADLTVDYQDPEMDLDWYSWEYPNPVRIERGTLVGYKQSPWERWPEAGITHELLLHINLTKNDISDNLLPVEAAMPELTDRYINWVIQGLVLDRNLTIGIAYFGVDWCNHPEILLEHIRPDILEQIVLEQAPDGPHYDVSKVGD